MSCCDSKPLERHGIWVTDLSSPCRYDRRIMKARDSVHPIILIAAYSLIALAWNTAMPGPESTSVAGHWYLPAGLSFGLMLRYGSQRAPLLFAVHLFNGVWSQTLPSDLAHAAFLALGTST